MKNIMTKIFIQDFKSFLIKSFFTLHHHQRFADNWHFDFLSKYLESAEQRKITRLIINIAPRSLKSICISVAWPAWLLAINPSYKIIAASYSQALSVKHSIDCRKIMMSDWYQQLFHNTKIAIGENSKNKFVTERHGFRLATSIGGTLTGEGADFLIVDDPMTPMHAFSKAFREKTNRWFEQTLLSRLNDQKHGVIVIIMQRLHVNDLTGFLLKKGYNWHVINLPLIAEKDEKLSYEQYQYTRKKNELLLPKIYDTNTVEELKKNLGMYTFAAQYQQSPIQLNTGIIKTDWIQYYEKQPAFEAIFQSWDCAIKAEIDNDYSVCSTWGIYNMSYYLIDIVRQKLIYPILKQKIIDHHRLFKPNAVIIEDKASGQQIIQELQHQDINIIKYVPQHDKTTRLILISTVFESNKVMLPKSATWLEDFVYELTNFPNTEHDDQIDSTTQFLTWFEKKNQHLKYSARVL